MSAGILKALMQLFAIIARGGDDEAVNSSSREVVAIFLRQQLNRALVDEYLVLYDEFVKKHHTKKGGDKKRKRTAVNSVKILKICSQINEELAHKEKIFVLTRLLEFIIAIDDSTPQEWEFVETVAETFNIAQATYDNLKTLISLGENDTEDHPDFLYATHNGVDTLLTAKQIHAHGLGGRLVFYRIEEVNMFFLRLFGNDDLLLNGQVLIPNRCHVFNQGSSVRGSKMNPIYFSDVIRCFLDNKSESSITFRAENLSYYFKRANKQALHQLNIDEQSGNLIGIMGGSGSGKSTLLNVLNGNYTPTFGKVTINGVDIHHEAEKLEGVIGHVAQDDLLIEELSVFENLFYNAKLCFANKGEEEIHQLTEQTLHSLGLFEAKDLKVGSPLDKTISGGQRKRLNIALELIREPSVMFVDEPTSGLSSRDSENIMDLLKELTLKGKLIFVVIHQPSSDIFKMFDKLFLLDQGGYPIYYGNPVESVMYFKKLVNHVNQEESECPQCGNVNPEQIFNIIESKVVDEYGQITEHRKTTPKEWNNFFNVIIGNHIEGEAKRQDVPESSFEIPNKFVQFKTFITRDVLSKISNRQYMMINFLEAPLLAFVLSFFIKYYASLSGKGSYIFRESENIPQYLFISVIVSLFLGLTVAAEEIIRDQKILKREQFLNLSKGSYLMSKISIMFTISAIQSLCFVLVGNAILEIQGMMLSYWLILFSTSCFANLLGLNISASFNSAKVIYILIPILIIPQLLFSGIIVKFDKLYPLFAKESGVPWIGNIMASRWAYEALAVNQFKNNEFESQFYSYDQRREYYNWKKDFWVKELANKISKCKKALGDPEKSEEFGHELRIIHNELSKEERNIEEYSCEVKDKLNVVDIDEATLSDLEADLDVLKSYYIRSYNLATSQKEKKLAALTDTEEKEDQFLALQDSYHNESLKDFVTNNRVIKAIVEESDELVHKSDPIYFTPVHKSFFDAHFYAPSKRFMGKQISTLPANMLVIWGMTFLLSALLFKDGMRWFIESISSISERFKGKKGLA